MQYNQPQLYIETQLASISKYSLVYRWLHMSMSRSGSNLKCDGIWEMGNLELKFILESLSIIKQNFMVTYV